MAIKVSGIEKAINPAFLPRLKQYEPRIIVEYGGAGSGKSHFVVQKMIVKGMAEKRRVLVVRKVARTLRESVFKLFLQILSPIRPAVRSINKTDMTISLVNGTEFIFSGLDDAEKIKSIVGIDDIIIEEATELLDDDFTQLRLRLRSGTKNQLHLMFNPVSKANWVYRTFFLDPPSNAAVYHSTWEDNEHLPAEYIEDIKRLQRTNPAYYRIYVLGEFATLDKLVYPLWEKRIIAQEEVAGLPQWCGLDHGYNDPAAITWGAYDGQGKRIFITGEYNRSEMLNDQLYQTICKLGLSRLRIVADSADKKSNEELRRAGLLRLQPAAKGPDSVINGIKWVLSHDLIVDERCVHVINELENYTWVKDKKTGEYLNDPIDAFNHHLDALRYGLEPMRGTGLGFAPTLSSFAPTDRVFRN